MALSSIRTCFFKGLPAIIITVSLIGFGVIPAKAEIPPVLDLEVVTAPNYQSSPCPMNMSLQNSTGNTGNGSGFIDHAAHHRSGGTGQTYPDISTDSGKSAALKQFEQSSGDITGLLQILQTGTT